MKLSYKLLLGLIFLGACRENINQQPQGYPIQLIALQDVTINDAFWSPRLAKSTEATIPHAMALLTEHGQIANFEVASGNIDGVQQGWYSFEDSDIYKVIEGIAWNLVHQPDSTLENEMNRLIQLVTDAQEDDGYLFTWQTNQKDKTENPRWNDIQWRHELYCAGHLYEAAVAHHLATGKRNFLEVALKNADLMVATFGKGKIELPPGHQEIEMGLVKLYQVTEEQKYLDLAKFFLEERGNAQNGRELWGEYAQDHLPLLEQKEAVGHAVRAAYFYSAIADVGAFTHNPKYLEMLDTVWENVVSKKMYVTGGTGAVGFGERYGENYELPNFSAYSETCSSIAQVMWNRRMFQLHGDAKYIDVMERTLYNAVLSGIAMDGKHFFYPNVLASRGFDERSEWFKCNCCPSNLSRFIPQLPTYIYAIKEDELYVNLYIGSEAQVTLNNQAVKITQETNYPWEGTVALKIAPAQPTEFTVKVRIPGWATNKPIPSDLYTFADTSETPISLKVNDEVLTVKPEKGYVAIKRTWQPSDVITLNFPMPVRQVQAHKNLVFDNERIALQRGPLVYALEGHDQPKGDVLSLAIDTSKPITASFDKTLWNGINTLTGTANQYTMNRSGALEAMPQLFLAIPYYAWAHRGKSPMAVWLATTPEQTEPINKPMMQTQAAIASSEGSGNEVIQVATLPTSSKQPVSEAFVWNNPSETLWIQYNFKEAKEISASGVYWLDNGADIVPPESWRVQVNVAGVWETLYNLKNTWETAPNKLNIAQFETGRSNQIRLEVKPQLGKKVGILRWQLF